MPIDMKPVRSSLASAVGYDADTRTLAVKHNDGTLVHYHGVSKETHEGLLRAKSKGSYLHSNVRGKHKHTTF